jgi:hypothetical protein
MLLAMFADAVFCAAFLAEALALISILHAVQGVQLNEAFTPVLRFYHAETAPLLSVGSALFAGKPPVWFADAAIISAVFFFLFFIEQARNAMAPYPDDDGWPSLAPTRLDAAIDFVLPPAICGVAAVFTAPTLLPFLTLPAALVLLLRNAIGGPSWFKVSPSFYVNLLLLAAIAAALFASQG